jgi:hypothetical protein
VEVLASYEIKEDTVGSLGARNAGALTSLGSLPHRREKSGGGDWYYLDDLAIYKGTHAR